MILGMVAFSHPHAEFEPIEVSTANLDDALRFIAGYLIDKQQEGWTIVDARALVDGWRNEYDLRKDSRLRTLQFDLRKSKNLGDRMGFTLASMSLCVRGEVKANLEKALLGNRRLRGEPEPLTPVTFIIGVGFGLLILFGLLAMAINQR